MPERSLLSVPRKPTEFRIDTLQQSAIRFYVLVPIGSRKTTNLMVIYGQRFIDKPGVACPGHTQIEQPLLAEALALGESDRRAQHRSPHHADNRADKVSLDKYIEKASRTSAQTRTDRSTANIACEGVMLIKGTVALLAVDFDKAEIAIDKP